MRSAGEWLSEQNLAQETKILSNEVRGPFFAGFKLDKIVRTRLPAKHDLHKLEKKAIDKNIDVILIEVKKGLDIEYSNPTHFQKIKKISGKKSNVYIYYDPFITNNLSN